MMSNVADDQRYIQEHGDDIRRAAWRAGMQRHAERTMPAATLQTPITDGVTIPCAADAAQELFMALAHYYLDRASLGRAIPRDVAKILRTLQEAIHDPEICVSVLNEALCFFVHSMASVESQAVRIAIKAAQLSLKSLQDTYAEMPATTAEWRSEYWLWQ